jgi:hypothetical protein
VVRLESINFSMPGLHRWLRVLCLVEALAAQVDGREGPKRSKEATIQAKTMNRGARGIEVLERPHRSESSLQR